MFGLFKGRKQLEAEHNSLVTHYDQLSQFSKLQNEEIVRVTCDFIALELALRELYDPETVEAIIVKAKTMDGYSYLQQMANTARPSSIQISLNFFS